MRKFMTFADIERAKQETLDPSPSLLPFVLLMPLGLLAFLVFDGDGINVVGNKANTGEFAGKVAALKANGEGELTNKPQVDYVRYFVSKDLAITAKLQQALHEGKQVVLTLDAGEVRSVLVVP